MCNIATILSLYEVMTLTTHYLDCSIMMSLGCHGIVIVTDDVIGLLWQYLSYTMMSLVASMQLYGFTINHL